MDQERVSFNLGKIRKGGQTFEVVVDPDLAIGFRNGEKIDIRDVLKGEKVFSDAKKGVLAPESAMKDLFGSSDPLSVASKILKEGEIQLTTEYRDKLREEKKRKILAIIQRNAADPKTRLPHPLTRIENAFEQCRCKVDELRSAEEQVDGIVKAMRTVLPISIEQMTLQIHVPPQFAHKSFGMLKKFGTMKRETWGNDGSLVAHLEIPAGMQEEVMNQLNNLTHGGVEIEVVK
jgi:ribosome maturation protein SDO1